MPPWLIATALGIGLPYLFKDKQGQPAQGQPGQGQVMAGGPGLLPGMQPQSQVPPQQAYPIPLDPNIDPQSAYAIFNAWKTAPAATLQEFARQIWNQYPIAASALFARGLTILEIQAAQQAYAQRAAQTAPAPAPAPVAQAPVQVPQGPQGGVPATQSARIVPTPSIVPMGVETNGAPVAAAPAPTAPEAVPAPIGVG